MKNDPFVPNTHFAVSLPDNNWVEEARASAWGMRRAMSSYETIGDRQSHGFSVYRWMPVNNDKHPITDWVPSLQSWLNEKQVEVSWWTINCVHLPTRLDNAIHIDKDGEFWEPWPEVDYEEPMHCSVSLNLPLDDNKGIDYLNVYRYRFDETNAKTYHEASLKTAFDVKVKPAGALVHGYYKHEDVDLEVKLTNVSNTPFLLNARQPHLLVKTGFAPKRRLMIRFKNNPYHIIS